VSDFKTDESGIIELNTNFEGNITSVEIEVKIKMLRINARNFTNLLL
jgi:hypothetical protein